MPQSPFLTCDSNSINGTTECSHLPNSILELPCVLCHPHLPTSLGMTARLLATSKAVAAAARAARSNQLQELHLDCTSSSEAQQAAAWISKNAAILQGIRTLKLQLDRTAIESCSKAAGSGMWGMLTSPFAAMFDQSTVTATAAAAILQSMPRTLSRVILQLQSNVDVRAIPLRDLECAIIRAELAALPNLQSISLAGPGAAACLPYSLDLAVTFSQLTSIRMGTIRSHAGVAQLLQGLPASLLQLRLDVDTPDRLAKHGLNGSRNREWLLQLQRSVQMAHLTALTTLHVTGRRFVIGEDSTLPPNLINLTAPMVMHERPLLQLTRLQHLDAHNLNMLAGLRPGSFGSMSRCLTQLTYMKTGMLHILEADAPEVIAGLAALPLKSLRVLSYGPHPPGAEGGDLGPAAAGALLGQLTSLTSLAIALGAYSTADVAASLAQLTGLQELFLSTAKHPTLWDDVAACESLADAIVALEQLRRLTAAGTWFGEGYALGAGAHPIMRLQAATQLTYLDLCGLRGDPAHQNPDWAALLTSLPGVELGEELALLKA